jgi:hypothetical protein
MAILTDEEIRTFLIENKENNIISENGIFEYYDLQPEKQRNIYSFFEGNFKLLFKGYADRCGIDNYFFGSGAYCGDIIGGINEQRRQRNEM